MNNAAVRSSLRRLLSLVVLIGAALLVISAVANKQDSQIQEVNIDIQSLNDGSMLIKAEDIQNSIERGYGLRPVGMAIKSLDVKRLEDILEGDPLILDADVFIDARNRLRISVVQRQPILRIIDQNGMNYYLDDKGIKMPLSKHFAARVLVASGNIPPHVPDFLDRKFHLLKDLFNLSNDILGDEFLAPMIQQIYVSNRGEFTLIPVVGDQKIIFGRYEEDAAAKLRKLKIFYREGLPRAGWRKYRTLDLRYRGQVVCD
ncbi:MAG: hypothetical protein H6555_00015 [Lewinellaceae bacterium]|nr:hypothetical protein [Lewinellaceae bacterium]